MVWSRRFRHTQRMRQLSPRLLRRLIDYDPITGALTWRERPFWLFKDRRSWKSWNGRFAGKPALATPNGNGYFRARVLNVLVYAHRAAWAIHHGTTPDVIDHISGDTTDNRMVNLRDGSQAENMKNRTMHSNNTSGITGVCYRPDKGKWWARIGRKHIGYFETESAAIYARQRAEKANGYGR